MRLFLCFSFISYRNESACFRDLSYSFRVENSAAPQLNLQGHDGQTEVVEVPCFTDFYIIKTLEAAKRCWFCVTIHHTVGLSLRKGTEKMPPWTNFYGFGSSLFLVGLTTYQTLAVPEHIRGSSFTLATAGTIAPLVMILPLAEWLLRSGMYRAYIWFPVLAAAMCLAVAYSIGSSDEINISGADWGSYREVFKNPAIRVLFVSVILFAMTDAAIVSLAGLASEKGSFPFRPCFRAQQFGLYAAGVRIWCGNGIGISFASFPDRGCGRKQAKAKSYLPGMVSYGRMLFPVSGHNRLFSP